MGKNQKKNDALAQAIKDGDLEAVRAALAAGADARATDGIMGETMLKLAAEAGSVDVVRALLEAGADPDEAGDDEPPLLAAVSAGAPLELIDALLAAGADAAIASEFGETPLLAAITGHPRDRARQLAVVERLLAAGADPNATNDQYGTVLANAAGSGLDEVVERLLAAGADPDVVIDGSFAAGAAARAGHLELARRIGAKMTAPGLFPALFRGEAAVKAALAAGADPNQDQGGLTPMHVAARLGDLAVVRVLLAAGASPGPAAPKAGKGKGKKRSAEGEELRAETPLGAAARLGHTEVGKALLAAGAAVDLAPSHDVTPLAHAARRGDLALIEALAAAGANLKPETWPRPIVAALETKQVEAAQLLLRLGAGDPATLLAAIAFGQSELALALLERGISPDAGDESGPAIVTAVRYGSPAIVEALLAKGADPNAKGEFKRPCLSFAAERGDARIVELLIEKGAKLDAKHEGFTALQDALVAGQPAAARALLTGGAKLGGKGKLLAALVAGDRAAIDAAIPKEAGAVESSSGWTALHMAAFVGDADATSKLLAAGADPRAEAKGSGETPLQAAARLGRPAVVSALLATGAFPVGHGALVRGLHAAAAAGHAEVVRRLLAHGVDPDAREPGRKTALMEAAEPGHVEVVDALLAGGANPRLKTGGIEETALDVAERFDRPEVVARLRAAASASPRPAAAPPAPAAPAAPASARPTRSPAEVAALVRACQTGDRAAVDAYLAGGDPNVADERGVTPLRMAIAAGHDALALALLDAGAKVGDILLHFPYAKGSEALLRRLFELGADPNVADPRGRTPLMMACGSKAEAYVRLLIERGADVAATTADGSNALGYALSGMIANPGGSEEIALLLIERGASPDGKGTQSPLALALSGGMGRVARKILTRLAPPDGKTPLVRAIADGDRARVEALLLDGADPNAPEPKTKWPPLLLALALGEWAIAKRLLAAGADAKATRGNQTPLGLAIGADDPELFPALVAAGADPDALSADGTKLLISATRHGNAAAVRALLAAGASVDTANQGATSLHLAADLGHAEIVEALLAKGAKLEAKESHKRTPLVVALAADRLEVARRLIAAGAKVDVMHGDLSLLAHAVSAGRGAAVELLLAGGAKSDAPKGEPPLLLAARDGHDDLVEALLAKGAKVDVKAADGETALLAALGSGHAGIARTLLARGASANAATKGGRDALDLAIEAGDLELVAAVAKGSAAADRSAFLALAAGELASDARSPRVDREPLRLLIAAGRSPLAERLLAEGPSQAAIERAMELAAADGLDDWIQRLANAGGVRPGGDDRGPSEGALDASAEAVGAAMRRRGLAEGPLVFEGTFGRYLAVPREHVEARLAAHAFMDPWRFHRRLADLEQDLARRGFVSLGSLVCDRVPDVVAVGFADPSVGAWFALNLGLLETAMDVVSSFRDGAWLTTTSSERSSVVPAKRLFGLGRPGASPGTLIATHRARVGRRPAAIEPVAATLASFAQAIDRALSVRYGAR